MSQTAIKVENLSKIYRLGEIGTGTISRDMERWFKTRILKQEDPFLKIGETNDRANKGASDIVYSLQDINFEINQGDAVGIIGRNGAGKSTLLKILSRVTTPTTGKINIKGRVASLLEVGTGFHPELTGRENIYLNGAILGMRKREIDRKLDEIIDFSGVERYIDTPVKRYSSGMYVRLAFAVAAHLESEILIVDEVLAVGDAEFQKKCLGKMGEVSKGEGRTVLFVSHNMAAVKQLCSKGMFINKGIIQTSNGIQKVIEEYTQNITVKSPHREYIKEKSENIFISKIWFSDANDVLIDKIEVGKTWNVNIQLTVQHEIRNLIVGLGILDHENNSLRTSWADPKNLSVGSYHYSFSEKNLLFSQGLYRFVFGLSIGHESIQYLDDDILMEFIDLGYYQNSTILNRTTSRILNPMNYEINKIL